MRTRKIEHNPGPGSKSKGYVYTEYTFTNPREAWLHFGIGPNDSAGQARWLSKEATRRDREKANAAVNSPNAAKPAEVKILNMASRTVNAPKEVVAAAKAGDVNAIHDIMSRYQDVLRNLEEAIPVAS